MNSSPVLRGAVLGISLLVATAWGERQQLQVRLTAPVASYMKAGTPMTLRVVGALDGNTRPVLPVGSLIAGRIGKAHPIGYGIRRERAELELEFTGCRLADGKDWPCDVSLASVDNARESVLAGNRIRGVLAASHPHSWLNGIWYRPTSTLLHRSAVGFTGAGGMIYTRVAPTPMAGAAVIAARLILFRMADADIEIPGGADLVLDVTADPVGRHPAELPKADVTEESLTALAELSPEITDADGRKKADVVNFAFVASREQLVRAFQIAGWSLAEALTPRTFAKTYAAVAARKTYPSAPVSPLYYERRLPDMVFQKAFNSLRKRHHIRLWEVKTAAGPVWVGAATHDVAVQFQWQKFSFTHLIDPEIDKEQRKILNDFAEVGCLGGLSMVERPWLAREARGLESASTAGDLAVIRLQSCTSRAAELVLPSRGHRNWTKVVAARFFLETRHYLTRGSAYYWGYRSVRWSLARWRPGQLSGRPVDEDFGINGALAGGAPLCYEDELP
ncbi:MAG: LssY C-terminal domain-containing protein [Bryobacterales bacterium]|nr:LssY C-terminal domain-containing protein [Bryobacterales bacterium]